MKVYDGVLQSGEYVWLFSMFFSGRVAILNNRFLLFVAGMVGYLIGQGSFLRVILNTRRHSAG